MSALSFELFIIHCNMQPQYVNNEYRKTLILSGPLLKYVKIYNADKHIYF